MGRMSDDYGMAKPKLRWSFSQWETYNSCPAKWKYGSILKLPRKPPGPAAARGLEIHDTVEKYITTTDCSVGDLHPAIKPKYIPIFDEFKNHPNGERYAEKKLAFDPEWSITAPTSQFAACIAVLDAVRVANGVAHIGEWKSGKPKDSHADQRKLYAMFGYRAWNVERVEVTTYYLEDTGDPQRIVLASQSGFEKLANLWDERIKTMLRDDMCAPRPGFMCRFCDFANSQGGPCQFG
jgi:hypothetical protein